MEWKSSDKPWSNLVFGGGEMGARINNFNWDKTPLGNIRNWSQSLITSVNLILNSTQPMWIGWGKENTFIYNDPYVEVLGLSKHEWALGRPAYEVWAEIWDFCGPLSDKVFKEGKASFVNNVHFFMKRGDFLEEVFYSFSYSPIYDEAGAVGGLFCPNIETTAKLLNERRLRTLSDLSAKALVEKTIAGAMGKAISIIQNNREDIPFAAIYLKDSPSNSVSLQQYTGLPPGLLPNKIELDDAGNRQNDSWHLQEAFRNTRALTISVEQLEGIPHGLSDQKLTHAIVLPLSIPGEHTIVGAVIAGINPTRKLDAEYSTFFDLLAAQVSTAYQNVDAAEKERKRAQVLLELNQAKTDFLSNISHEFRTPLTLMLGPLEELLEKKTTTLRSDEKENIEATHRNALRLLKLVNTLLDFSRIETGKSKIFPEPTDLAGFTAGIAGSFRSLIEKAGLQYKITCDPIAEPAMIDRSMWEKIILNLLSNAFKYTLQGSIELNLQKSGENIVLYVQDTGIGIPEKELPHMFDRFHRIRNNAGRSFEGSGIGLSLVKELVAMHQGQIEVSSMEKKGSRFTVYLPFVTKNDISPLADTVTPFQSHLSLLSQAMLAELSHLGAKAPGDFAATAQETKDRKPRLLIVDDNEDMLSYISRLLEYRYELNKAGNGREALDLIGKSRPDLVISDIMMPVMDGIELLTAIKNNPATANLPVILLSARAGEESRIEGYEVGADDYLVKPFSSKELLARVVAQLRIVHTRMHIEQQLRNLFIQAPVGIIVLSSPEMIIEIINAKAIALFALGDKQTHNRTVWEVCPQLNDGQMPGLFYEVVETGKGLTIAEKPVWVEKDNEIVQLYLQISLEALYNEEGRVRGIILITNDITDQINARKRVEESERLLRTTQDQFELAVNAGNIGIWHWDFKNNKLKWSREQEALYGLAEGEFDGTLSQFESFVYPEDLKRLQNPGKLPVEKEKDSEYEFRIIRKDGQLRWLYTRAKTILDKEGHIEYESGVSIDITDQKTFAENLELLVAARTQELMRTNKELESFNYIASHDLQEPLRKIQTFSQLLIRFKDDRQQAATFLDKIRSSAQRMSDLIQSVLTYSKLSKQEMGFSATNLNQVIDNIRTDFEVLIEERKATIISEELPTIMAVPVQMNQLFSNLIGNSLKFSKENPVIRISACQVRGREIGLLNGQQNRKFVQITVSDNGIGFEEQYTDKIFNLFQRLHNKTEYQGTGIGLSICKKIVESHQGFIKAHPNAGKGASFIIHLPLEKEQHA